MYAHLLSTVLFQLLSEGIHLSLKLFITSKLWDFHPAVAFFAVTRRCCTLLIALSRLLLVLRIPAYLCLWRRSLFTWPSRGWPVCSSTCWLASISSFWLVRSATLGLGGIGLNRLYFALHWIDILHRFRLLLVWLFLLPFALLWFLFLFPLWLHDVVH